jgi:FKBP-type peptidyl-prolyl cis-trans isomerase
MRNWLVFAVVVLLFGACSNPYPGFEEVDNQLYAKLERFGEGEPVLGEADNALLRIQFRNLSGQDSARDFDTYLGKLTRKGLFGTELDSVFFQQLTLLKGGEVKSFVLPYSKFRSTFLDAYQANFYRPEEMVEIRIEVLKTFRHEAFVNFLMNSAQHNEMEETKAIDLMFLDSPDSAEWHGDICLKRLVVTEGDTVRAGRDITIRYNTYLLNGNRLDSTTTMNFNFGRPGQLTPGLSYALSLMKSGERALVYMPSALAFGEEGSSTGLVPRNTPIYMNVEVLEVQKFETMSPKGKLK